MHPNTHTHTHSLSQYKYLLYFEGCRQHGHDESVCPITRRFDNDKLYQDEKHSRRAKTEQKKKFTMDLGIKYIELYECEYNRELKEDQYFNAFVESEYPAFFKKYRRRHVRQEDVLQSVKDGTLFGAILVNIHVPDSLYHRFSELCPLFVNSDVPWEALGKCMQDLWNETHEMQYGEIKPYEAKRLLVGGMRAEHVLLSSPLLAYYLELGLVVSKVHKVRLQKAPTYKIL